MVDIIGDNNPNILNGFASNDRIFGRAGNDLLRGNAGNDQLFGEGDNDTMIGGTGSDRIFGGTGNDRSIWNNGDGSDVIDGGVGNDIVEVNGAALGDNFVLGRNVASADPTDVLFRRTNLVPFSLDVDNVERFEVNGLGGNDQLDVNSLAGTAVNLVEFNGGDGNDRLDGAGTNVQLRATGGAGNDVLIGGSASDNLSGNAGNDNISGNAGNDNISGGDGNDTLNGGVGNDSILGGDGSDTILGGNGNDSISAGDGNDSVFGGDGNDSISGGNGNDVLRGEDGNDTISGNAGNDIILGGDGNDTIRGNAGNDVLTGGNGADRYVFGSGAVFDGDPVVGAANDFDPALGVDRITNFNILNDRIVLDRSTFAALPLGVLSGANFASVANNAVADNSSALIVYSRATGDLFYNQDRAFTTGNDGFGTGGLFATLDNRPALLSRFDIEVVA